MAQLGWLIQPAVFPWVAFAFGLCAGSFLNVVIHRLPRMMERAWRADCAELAGKEISQEETYNLIVPRSACPGCASPIKAWQNVPLFSWVLLGGKCANCKAPISLRYPLVELLAGIGAAGAALQFGFGLAALAAALFVWCTIALAAIDQATGYLPDDLTIPLLWLGLLVNAQAVFVPLGEAVVGAAAGYLVLWSIYWLYKLARGVEGMGYGDFKMTAAVGAFVGWKMLPLVILLSSVVGLAAGIAQMALARGGWDAKFRIHFGPYIAIAGIAALFWGPGLLARVPLLKIAG